MEGRRDWDSCAQDANSELLLEREQKIPPLRCGMTNKKSE
jgi:hypothetical protein